MMSWIVIGWVLLAASVLAVLSLIFWIAAGRRNRSSSGTGSLDVIADPTSRYRVMERLSSRTDVEFLSRLPGYRPEIGRRLHRAQRKAFRGYLKELRKDFSRLHRIARRIVSAPDTNSPEFVRLLIRQRIVFELEMALLEVRLILSAVVLAKVDTRPLIEMMERLHLDLAQREPLSAA